MVNHGHTEPVPSKRCKKCTQQIINTHTAFAIGCLLLTVVGLQVLVQLVALVLQHVAQVGGDLARRLLDVSVQLAQIIGQSDQLIERTDLKRW